MAFMPMARTRERRSSQYALGTLTDKVVVHMSETRSRKPYPPITNRKRLTIVKLGGQNAYGLSIKHEIVILDGELPPSSRLRPEKAPAKESV